MQAKKIDGTVYSHPIGLNGHGAGPLIGLWDYQDGVAGRGDTKVTPSMWYSIELQATTAVPEWGGQRVRMAQEEDVIIDAGRQGPVGVETTGRALPSPIVAQTIGERFVVSPPKAFHRGERRDRIREKQKMALRALRPQR